MTSELFTFEGRRKYLTSDEQGRFIAAANAGSDSFHIGQGSLFSAPL